MKTRSMLVLGLLLLAAGAAVAALTNDGETIAHRLGAATGSVGLAIGLVAGAKWVWIKIDKRDERVLSHGAVFAAGLLSICFAVMAAGREAREKEEDREQFVSEVEQCDAGGPSPLDQPPRGLTYGPLAPREETFVTYMREAMEVDSDLVFEGRRVLENGRYISLLLVTPGSGGPDEFSEVEDGFRQGAEEQGLVVRTVPVAGGQALLGSGPRGAVLLAAVGCHGIQIVAQDGRSVRFVARRMGAKLP